MIKTKIGDWGENNREKIVGKKRGVGKERGRRSKRIHFVPGGEGVLQKNLTGVCHPWYGTLYPIVGQILDKIIPYCRANFYKIFKTGHRTEKIFSEYA